MRSDAVFAGLVTALFFAAAATVAAHHEMWRDECQAWLIARDANSLTELRDHMHYEGHPAGWHAVLFVLTRWSDDPRVMQACTLLFATVSTWIVARHAPFSRLTRALWVFGYFPFYEYTVLARSYTLSVLLVLAATLFATKRQPSWSLTSVCVVLLSHTCVHGVILAAGVLAACVVRVCSSSDKTSLSETAMPMALMVFGMLSAAVDMAPPPDSGFQPDWHLNVTSERVGDTLTLMARAYVPVPRFESQFWETRVWEGIGPLDLLAPVFGGACLLLGTVIVCRGSGPAAALFLVSSMGLLGFFYVKFSGGMRHNGFLWISLFVSAWMARAHENDRTRFPQNGALRPIESGIAAIFLALHCNAAAMAAWTDVEFPFSNAQSVAGYLEQNGYARMPLVVDPDYISTGILAYSGKEQCYHARADRMGSFIIWDLTRTDLVPDWEWLSPEEILQRTRLRTERAFLFVTNRQLEPLNLPAEFRLMASFPDGIVADEVMHVYLVSSAAGASDLPDAAFR